MSNSSLAFAFDEPSPPLVATAAQTMAFRVGSRPRAFTQRRSTRIMTSTSAEAMLSGAWSVRDAHAALELAQVQYLQASDQIQLSSPIDEADQFFCCLDARIPTQTNRSDEQIEWQQFATPPRLAWLAARACALAQTSSCSNPRPEQGCSRSGRPRPARALPQRNLAAAPRLPDCCVPGCPRDRP
jgi:hypothetical protein